MRRLDALRREVIPDALDDRWDATWVDDDVLPVPSIAGTPHPELEPLVPLLVRAVRAFESGSIPGSAIKLLRAVDTPRARAALVGLYAEPRFGNYRVHPQTFGPLLIDLDDPRVGPLALARHAAYAEQLESHYESIDHHLPLVARHGGDEGVRIISAAARGQLGGLHPRLSTAAWRAIGWTRDARLLAVALETAPAIAPRILEESGVNSLSGLVRTFGEPAVTGLRGFVADRRSPTELRWMSAAALARAAVPDHLTADALLPPDPAADAVVFAGAAEELGKRSLEVERLRADAVRALGDEASRPWVLRAIRHARALHTPELRDAVAALPPDEEETLERIERTLGRRAAEDEDEDEDE